MGAPVEGKVHLRTEGRDDAYLPRANVNVVRAEHTFNDLDHCRGLHRVIVRWRIDLRWVEGRGGEGGEAGEVG